MTEEAKIFSTNFNHYLAKSGLQQKEIAEKLGVSTSAVSTWSKGIAVPRMDKIQQLSIIFECRKSDLIEKPVDTTFDARPVPPQGMVPVIGLASAGKGVIATEDILGYESADKHYADNPEYRYIKVVGDSMSPKIDDGDLVLVHYQTSVDSGSVGVFIVDGEDGYVKKVEYDTEYIHLISFNPYYPPMVFEGPDVLRVRVVGKVVSLVRKF